MSVMKTGLTIFPCVLGSAFPIIRVCSGLSFATKGLAHLAALYLLLLLVARYNLSYHKTICYHLFQYLQRIPCWKPLIISFCSSLGSILLLIERTTIDPLYLWVISYQTSQHKWVIIKVLYRCLQRYLLGWRISRLGFFTPIDGEVYLGPLGNTHHLSLASIATNELVAGWCVTERVKRLAGNEIELGIEIARIESRASSIPMTKGTTYVVMRFDR